MRKFGDIFFVVLAAHLLVFLLGLGTYDGLVIFLFAIPIEFFVVLLLLFYKKHRETGIALLAASCLTILVLAFVSSGISHRIR